MEARGILEARGRRPAVRRCSGCAPPADLEPMIEHHWLVELGPARRPATTAARCCPTPACTSCSSRPAAAVYGVSRSRYVRRLSGTGWALGHEVSPRRLSPVRSPAGVGADRPGARRSRSCSAPKAPVWSSGAWRCQRPADALGHVQGFLRARLPAGAADDPDLRLVRQLTAAMAAAAPGARVADIAARSRRLGSHGPAPVLRVRRRRSQVGAAALPPARGAGPAARRRGHRLGTLRARPRLLRPGPFRP